MPEPVTESLVVHWRPTVQYHQHRLDLLTDLQSAGVLEEFQVQPEWIGLRTAHTQVTMDEDQVSLAPRGPVLGGDTLDILRAVVRCVSPSQFRLTVTRQFLVPIPSNPYDEARRLALDQIALGHVGASDFALLIDGTSGKDDWHCEFGIVSQEEVEPRIRRWVGRARSHGGEVPPFVQLPSEIAPVSFFADFIWHVAQEEVEDSGPDRIVDDIARRVTGVGAESVRIVSAISAQLCGETLEAATKGSER